MKPTLPLFKVFVLIFAILAIIFTCRKEHKPFRHIEGMLKADNSYVYPYDIIFFSGINDTLTKETYSGTLGDEKIKLTCLNKTLSLMIPDMPAGKYLLTADIESKEYVLEIHVKSPSEQVSPASLSPSPKDKKSVNQ